MKRYAVKFLLSALLLGLLPQCATTSSGSGNLGGPTAEQRKTEIATEATGDFFYGRRYFIQKTRFWGYLRKPRQSASQSKLVIMREDQKKTPDRLPENGPSGQRYAFDHNFEYRIYGRYTGKTAYDPNSNQFLPEFMLTRYELINRQPGWLFRPDDRYNSLRITMQPR